MRYVAHKTGVPKFSISVSESSQLHIWQPPHGIIVGRCRVMHVMTHIFNFTAHSVTVSAYLTLDLPTFRADLTCPLFVFSAVLPTTTQRARAMLLLLFASGTGPFYAHNCCVKLNFPGCICTYLYALLCPTPTFAYLFSRWRIIWDRLTIRACWELLDNSS